MKPKLIFIAPSRSRDYSRHDLELRATTRLVRLLVKKGQSDEARAMLSDIYNWFIEGFDTADLKDAKALFDRDLLQHEEELVNRRIEQIVQSNVTPIYYR